MFDVGSYFPPAIKTICIACVSVFLAQELSQLLFGMAGWNFWLAWFGLVPQAVTHGFIWQLFTYIFLHGGIWHILFNLLYLCMFGADLERAWGSRKFYTYFFICGVGAGVINVIVKMILDPHGLGSARVPTIGASGGFTAVAGGCGDHAAPAGVGFSAAGDGFDARVCDCDGRDRIFRDAWGRRRQC